MSNIEKRGKSSYRLTVSCGYDDTGKKLFKHKTINLSDVKPNKQSEEAQKQWILFKDQVDKGLYIDSSKTTFKEFIMKWLKDYAEPELAPKTLLSYKQMLSNRIIPALGHIKLNKIQPTHLIEFYNNLREEGIRLDKKSGTLSDRTIQYYHRLISSILETAVKWQYILNNPAARVSAPKVKRKEVECFSIEQTQYLLDLLNYEPIKYKTAIYIAVFGGLRLGEICGLEWKDVNFKSGLIKIQRSSQYVDGRGIITKSPKNETSKRGIFLPEITINLLRKYKVWQNSQKSVLGNLWIDTDRIFTTNDGKYIYPDTISKWFHKFLKRHNEKIMEDNSIPKKEKNKYLLPLIKFHGLRHTNATLMLADGTDLPTVSKRLGHAQTSTTLNIYAHSLERKNSDAADRLENLFSIKKDVKKQI